MNKVYIYLVSGKSLNGKDQLYKLLKDEVGLVQVAFADKLKETVMDLYGFSYEQMYGNLKDKEDKRYKNNIDPKKIIDLKTWPDPNFAHDNGVEFSKMEVKNPEYKKYFTPRRILQIFGQDQRAIFPDIWVSYVFNTTIPNLIKDGHTKFIITDVRFKNEIAVAEQLQPKNSKLVKIRINRPGFYAKSCPDDISEIDLDNYTNWDYIIENTGSLDELKSKGLDIIKQVET